VPVIATQATAAMMNAFSILFIGYLSFFCFIYFVFLLATDNAAKKPAEKGCAKNCPAVVIIAVVVFDMMDRANRGVMLRVVMLLRRNMMFLRHWFRLCNMLLRGFLMLYRLMFRGGSATIISTTTRCSNSRTAKSNASESRNHQCFECLVHITPSLSFLLFHAALFAAYISCRKRFINFLTNLFLVL
jgi:hypothetical protein